MFNDIMQNLSRSRVIPLIAMQDEEAAVRVVGALAAGGITAVEIAFRPSREDSASDVLADNVTTRIARCIDSCVKAFPDVMIGAGTVTNAKLAKKAIDSGASFIVSPGFNPSTISYCIKENIAVIPGVSNPSQIEAALEMGLNTLKFFPAELMGGVKWLKAMAGPFPSVCFVATGGINESNAPAYLASPNCIAICGSYIAASAAIKAGDWKRITDNARNALAAS